MNEIRTENWCGHDIRFVEFKGEWWAVFKDICKALEIFPRTAEFESIFDDDLLEKIKVYNEYKLCVNELGIYKMLFTSDIIEARKFRRWSAEVMKKLRSKVGLQPYEAMRMTEPEVQDDIDHILDTLYWDEEKKMVMQSVTVAGGDVEQIPFE